MTRWVSRLLAPWQSARIRGEIADEIRFHIDRRTDDNVRAGMTPDAARRDAERRFGPQLRVAEAGYDVRGVMWLDALKADARFAARMLVKHKGFSASAIVTLALGIGANIAIFTLVDAVLLRPLPFRDPNRLVRIFDDLDGAGAQDVGMSVPELTDLQRRTDIFEQVAVAFPASTAFSGGDRVERIELLGTTPNYFELLGASAALGRVYGQREWRPGFLDTAVISDGLWRRQFGADPRVIGRRIRLDEDAYTIIGVMPKDFHHPGPALSGEVDVWGAAGFSAPPFATPPRRAQRLLPAVIGRLQSGVGINQAQRRVAMLVEETQRTYPTDYPATLGWTIRLEPLQATLTGPIRSMLLALAIAVGFVWLIVCVNVATLLLARLSARTREVAVRQAIGASRARLVRQMLTENLLLSLAGAAVAMIALQLTHESLLALMPADLPRITEVRADWWTFAAAIALPIVTALLFGVAPALQASGINPNGALKEGGRTGGSQSRAQTRFRGVLVAVEIALSVVLLTAAGLLIRSFVAMLQQPAGFNARGLTAAQIWIPVPNNPKLNRYLTVAQRAVLARDIEAHLGELPGVDGVALGAAIDLPFYNVKSAIPFSTPFSFTDDAATEHGDHAADFGAVSAGYFEVLGIPLKRGRALAAHDGDRSRQVAVVNDAFVRAFSRDRDPIGRRIHTGVADFDIVGVAGDVRADGLDVPTHPHVYASILQRPSYALSIFVRTRSDLASIQAALTASVHAVDPELPVFGVTAMDDLIAASTVRRRFSLLLMSVFALVALQLAAIGVYGVMAFVVSQRTDEFGIRVALGAQARDIFALALKPGLTVIGIGLAVGIPIAMLVARLMSALLFGVSATDPLTFAGVVLVLGGVAATACLVPAKRAIGAPVVDVLRR